MFFLSFIFLQNFPNLTKTEQSNNQNDFIHSKKITLISDAKIFEYKFNQTNNRKHHHHHHTKRQISQLSSDIILGFGSPYQQQLDRGPWSPWTDLSECTRTCGSGVYYQTRICLDPQRFVNKINENKINFIIFCHCLKQTNENKQTQNLYRTIKTISKL